MNLVKKVVLGGSLLVAATVLALTAAKGLDWAAVRGGGSAGSDDEILALTRALEEELGHEPAVDMVCVYPVVGVGPCVPGRGGSREVTLTFDDYQLPATPDPREHARRIARLAHERSVFGAESDKTVVVFREGDEWASVTRRYSFARAGLVAFQP